MLLFLKMEFEFKQSSYDLLDVQNPEVKELRRNYEGLKQCRISESGDCMFDSFWWGMYAQGLHKKIEKMPALSKCKLVSDIILALRSTVVEDIKKSEKLQFLTPRQREAIDNLRISGFWSDALGDLVLFSLAEMFQVRIFIYFQTYDVVDRVNIIQPIEWQGTINILYTGFVDKKGIYQRAHYEVLVPKNQKCSRDTPKIPLITNESERQPQKEEPDVQLIKEMKKMKVQEASKDKQMKVLQVDLRTNKATPELQKFADSLRVNYKHLKLCFIRPGESNFYEAVLSTMVAHEIPSEFSDPDDLEKQSEPYLKMFDKSRLQAVSHLLNVTLVVYINEDNEISKASVYIPASQQPKKTRVVYLLRSGEKFNILVPEKALCNLDMKNISLIK
jgi:hypothetical protein